MQFGYTLWSAHWNDGYGGVDLRKLTHEEISKAIHGHTWKVEVRVEGIPDSFGLLVDETKVKKAVLQFNFRFLPYHPKIVKGLRSEEQKLFAGSTEQMVEVLLSELEDICGRNISKLSVQVYETEDMWAEGSVVL